MSHSEVRVTSWNELNDCLFEDGWREDIRRFRPTVAYRGCSSCRYELSTGLARMGGRSKEIESAMLRAFQKYAPLEAVPGGSIWNWLALAQHHGQYTRLLDWSYSPFVALHFATCNVERFDEDGVVWTIDYRKSNSLLPRELKAILEEEASDVFTVDLLARAATTLAEFDALGDSDFVAFFEPPSFDARIVNQYALFSLLSSPDEPLDGWLHQHPHVYRRILIPADLKWEVRDKLDQANITERVLYLGLDGLTRWLNRYYLQRAE